MTGSYLERAAIGASGVVAMNSIIGRTRSVGRSTRRTSRNRGLRRFRGYFKEQYPRHPRESWARFLLPARSSRIRRCHRNLEVHQLVAAVVVYAGEVDVRTRDRVLDIFYVEEQEARLGGMGLDRLGGEVRTHDFVVLLLGLLVLGSTREHDWSYRPRIATALNVSNATENIVHLKGFQLRASGGHQLRTHFLERDRLVTVIADDQQHRQNSLLVVMCDENVVFRGRVIDIDSDGHLLVVMRILRWVSICIGNFGRDELFRGPEHNR